MVDSTRPADDAVLSALDGLMSAARANVVAWMNVMERIEDVRAQRLRGLPYTEMSSPPDVPRIIDVVSSNQERLNAAAAQFRRVLAQELIAEGWSSAEVARAFGVSRQRVGVLLRSGMTTAVVDADTEQSDGPDDGVVHDGQD